MTELAKKILQFALKWMAKFYLLENKPYVVVISGTTGRFWVKEKVVEALEEKDFFVRTNKKHFNAELGLPLSILDLPSGERDFKAWIKILWQAVKIIFPSRKKKDNVPDYFVLEMAVDKPENMEQLVSIVKPDMVILTTVTMVYQENFETLDEVAQEYKSLIETLPWNGVLILNNDDERIKSLAQYFEGKTITYGFSEGSIYKALEVCKIIDGQLFKVEVQKKEKEILNLKIARFGRHHIYAELIKEIAKENFKPQQKEIFGKILEEYTNAEV